MNTGGYWVLNDEKLKNMSFDLIRHYIRNFENEDKTDGEKGNYVKGVVDLYTEILSSYQNAVCKGE